MGGVYPILENVAAIKGDIRYYLCDLHEKYQQQQMDEVDLSNEQSCNKTTQTFINVLKFANPEPQNNILLITPSFSKFDKLKSTELSKRKTAPVGPTSPVAKRPLFRDKANSMHNKPLLKFQKCQSYERVTTYSSMKAIEDDKFNFDIGAEPEDVFDPLHPNDHSTSMDDKDSKAVTMKLAEIEEDALDLDDQEENKYDEDTDNQHSPKSKAEHEYTPTGASAIKFGLDRLDSMVSNFSGPLTPIYDLPKNVRFASLVGVKQYTVSEKSLSLDLDDQHRATVSSHASMVMDDSTAISEEAEMDWDYDGQGGTMLDIFGNDKEASVFRMGSQIEFNVYDFCDVGATDQEICEIIIAKYKEANDKKNYHESLMNAYQTELKHRASSNNEKNIGDDGLTGLDYERREFEKCESETRKYVSVLKQWKQDVIKSYVYEEKQELFTFEEQQQQFFLLEFRKLSSFFLDMHFVEVLFQNFGKALSRMTGKKIKKLTLQDIDNITGNYMEDFDFIFKPLMDSVEGLIDDKSLKGLCDRSLSVVNEFYDGEYTEFCKNVLVQIVQQMIEGKATPNTFISDLLSAIIIIVNDKRKFLNKLYKTENRNVCEKIVAVMALNLPPYYDEFIILEDDPSALNYVIKICDELKASEITRKNVKHFYEYFWKIHHSSSQNQGRLNGLNDVEDTEQTKMKGSPYSKTSHTSSSRASSPRKSKRSSHRHSNKKKHRKEKGKQTPRASKRNNNKARRSIDMTQRADQQRVRQGYGGYCGTNNFLGRIFSGLCTYE